jgi:hypothetical protein
VIRDNDVVVYNFAFRRLSGGRQATHEGSKNYGPFEQKPPLTERDCGRASTFDIHLCESISFNSSVATSLVLSLSVVDVPDGSVGRSHRN